MLSVSRKLPMTRYMRQHNQVTIAKAIVKAFELKEGDIVEVEIRKDKAMKQFTATVGTMKRITIPKSIVNELGISRNEPVELHVSIIKKEGEK